MPKLDKPLEIHGDFTDPITTESEAATALADPPEPRDYAAVDRLVEVLGDVLVSDGDVAMLFRINSANLRAHVPVSSRPTDPQGYRRETGYSLQQVAAWLKSENQEITLGALANLIVGTSAEDLMPDDAILSAHSASAEWGVPLDRLLPALRAGKIRSARDSNIACSAARLESGPLLRWCATNGIRLRHSIAAARRALNDRARAAVEREAGEQPITHTVVDKAFESLEGVAREEAEIAQRELSAMRASYRELLGRRDAPRDQDAFLLAEICDRLGYDRQRVEADAKLLDHVAHLERAAAGIEAACVALRDAGAEVVATKKRHEDESKAALARLREAQQQHALAVRARPELDSLRQQRPHLFD